MSKVETDPPVRRSLSRGGLVLAPTVGLANGINYGYSVLMAALLGPSAFGALGALLALVLIGSVPGLALQTVVARHAALLRSDGDPVGLWRATLHLSARWSAVLFAATALASPVLRGYLHLGSLVPALMLALVVAPTPFGFAAQGALLGREAFARLGTVGVTSAVCKLAGGLAPSARARAAAGPGGAGGAARAGRPVPAHQPGRAAGQALPAAGGLRAVRARRAGRQDRLLGPAVRHLPGVRPHGPQRRPPAAAGGVGRHHRGQRAAAGGRAGGTGPPGRGAAAARPRLRPHHSAAAAVRHARQQPGSGPAAAVRADRGRRAAHGPPAGRRRRGRGRRLAGGPPPERPPWRIWHMIWHTVGMRTTLDIDDDLLAALLERYPGRSKTEAIEAALRAYLAEDAVSRLRRLAGAFDIDDVSATTRAHDRRS